MFTRIIHYMHSPASVFLRSNFPNAFLLLSQIAERASLFDDPENGVEIGDAAIGDYWNAGIDSYQKYRRAKKQLEEMGYIKIKQTRRRMCLEEDNRKIKHVSIGTLVTLLKFDIFSLSNHFEEVR